MRRTLPWDWYDGEIRANVVVDDEAYLETTFSFHLYRSKADVGVRYARGAHTYLGTMFDVGPAGRVEIGDHAMLSWNVVLMDSHRVPRDRDARRAVLRALPDAEPRALAPDGSARPVVIEQNVWIGF